MGILQVILSPSLEKRRLRLTVASEMSPIERALRSQAAYMSDERLD